MSGRTQGAIATVMKLVMYNKEQYYFLSDKEFELAVESWSKNLPIYFKGRGTYLPPPRVPVGETPEHAGLEIYFINGNSYPYHWIAKTKGGASFPDRKLPAVLARVPFGEYYGWRMVNPKFPEFLGGTKRFEDYTLDDIEKIFSDKAFIDIETVLNDPELRVIAPTNQLLPRYAFS